MYCKHCGTKNSKSSNFCKKCGIEIIKKPSVDENAYPSVSDEYKKEIISGVKPQSKYKKKNITIDDDAIKTTEGKKDLIKSILINNDFNLGNIFLPDDNFYARWDGSDKALQLMADRLIKWLNFIPSVPLFVGFNDSINVSGIYISDGGSIGLKNFHAILVNSQYRDNSTQCAAILSHEIMHFYLMQMNQIILKDTQDNELLTDIGTIYSGFGVLIINSFFYSSGWFGTIIGLLFGFLIVNTKKLSFGYFKPEEYSDYFRRYLDEFKIDYSVCNYILPQSKKFLPNAIKHTKKLPKEELPQFINLARKSRFKANAIKIAILIVVAPVIIFLYASDTSNNSNVSNPSVSNTNSACYSELEAQKKDIDSLKAQMDQYSNTNQIDNYNALVPSYNAKVNAYNLKRNTCQ